MLDTTLIVNGDHIDTSLYSKPINSNLYLRFDSSHPIACRKSIPHSQFLRLRRICSDEDDFDVQVNTLSGFFREQGYPRSVVYDAKRKVQSLNRHDLLHRHRSDKNLALNRMTFPIVYHPDNITVCRTIRRRYNDLSQDEEIGHVFKTGPPVMAFKKDRSLKDRYSSTL